MSFIAKAIVVSPCDPSASGGIPGIMTSSLLFSGISSLATSLLGPLLLFPALSAAISLVSDPAYDLLEALS